MSRSFLSNDTDMERYIKAILEARQRQDGAGGASETGTVRGTNGLFRLNYFNGRSLTAEALDKEHKYWDQRASLVADIHPPGVAWGLGLDAGTQRPSVHFGIEGNDGRRDINAALAKFRKAMAEATKEEREGLRETYEQLIAAMEAYAPRETERTEKKWSAANGPIKPGDEIKLAPGLAFNNIGQPIVVGASFSFKFDDLMRQFISNQVVVVDGGTEFSPCVCIASIPKAGMALGPGLPAAPYLLCIEPIEKPEGEAKVYGSPCPTKGGALCETDGMRGGFSLSLVRVPVEVPLDGLKSEWELRSILSAYYFDVYEHSLIDRWGAPFPMPGDEVNFSAGTGRFDRQPGQVPLAMVYVASDQSILFLDPWIPRRSIASTASGAWAANLRGAPTPAACDARIHQFQGQLAEVIAARGGVDARRGPAFVLSDSAPVPNLVDLGFRSIPPFGFLPIPRNDDEREAEFFGHKRLDHAQRHANAYFERTNVITYTVVAMHDDDILEDMTCAMTKDPIQVRRCESARATKTESASNSTHTGGEPISPKPKPRIQKTPLRQTLSFETSVPFASKGAADTAIPAGLGRMIGILQPLFKPFIDVALNKCGGLTMERLINREIEIVKLVVPMEGLRREYPVVGAVKADLSVAPHGAFARAARQTPSKKQRWIDILAGDILGGAARPHAFVFYVKQRVALPILAYKALDTLLDILLLNPVVEDTTWKRILGDTPLRTYIRANDAGRGPATALKVLRDLHMGDELALTLVNSFVPVQARIEPLISFDGPSFKAFFGEPLVVAGHHLSAMLSDDEARRVAREMLRSYSSELGLRSVWTLFEQTAIAIASRRKGAPVDAEQVDASSRAEAIEVMLEEYAGFGPLKLASILLSPELLQRLLAELKAESKGGESAPLAHDVLHLEDGYASLLDDRAAGLSVVARRAFGARRLANVVRELPISAEITVDDALRLTPEELEGTVGRAAARVIIGKLKEDGRSLHAALGASLQAAIPAFWASFDGALAKNSGNRGAALKALKDTSDDEHRRLTDAFTTLHESLGDDGFDDVVSVARAQMR